MSHSSKNKLWLFGLLFLFLFIYLWQQVTLMRLGYLLSAERARGHELINENARLQVKIQNLKSMERIEALAHEAGFIRPKIEEVVMLSEPEAPQVRGFGRIGKLAKRQKSYE